MSHLVGQRASSLTICQTTYSRKLHVLNASLNETFPFFSLCEMEGGGGR